MWSILAEPDAKPINTREPQRAKLRKPYILLHIIINMDFNIVIEKDEDGWFVSEVVELPGCHTQAKSMDELIERTREAIELYLEEMPVFEVKNSFVGTQKIEI